MTTPPRPTGLDRRRFLRGGVLLGGAVLLAGTACGRNGADSQAEPGPTGATGDTGAATGDAAQVSYQGEAAITHLTAIVHSAPFHIAQALGYYEEEGLTLEHVSFPGGSDTIRGMESGIPLGSPASLPLFIAYEKGLDQLRIIGSVYNAASVDFIVPADSPINSVEDLEGAKIAVSTPGSNSTYFAERTVQEAGFTPGQDVELINVGGPGDAWTAASEGVVDVAWTASPLSERLVEEGAAKVVWRSRDFVEHWTDTVLATTQDFIDSDPDVLRAWVRAVQRAMGLINSDPEAAAESYAEAVDISAAVALAALQSAPAGTFTTELDMAGLEENVKAGLDEGQLTAEPDMSAIVVDEFLA
jgi:NitT/TauT family transport system substrate-binding protein